VAAPLVLLLLPVAAPPPLLYVVFREPLTPRGLLLQRLVGCGMRGGVVADGSSSCAAAEFAQSEEDHAAVLI
jgi:hypothetical protein